jgi:hypothetical protein
MRLFRNRLAQASVGNHVLSRFSNSSFATLPNALREIVDASLMRVSVKNNQRKEAETVKEATMTLSWKPSKLEQRDVYAGRTSKEAHDFAMQRMVQAGVVPVTWQQVLLEWQRDWKNRDTYDAVMDIVREHSGAYGMGVDYAYTMVHKAPARNRSEHEVLAPVAAN